MSIEKDAQTPVSDDALIAAAEAHVRRSGGGACLVRKAGTDFVVVAGPAETVFSLIEEDIEFYKQNAVPE